MEAFSIIFYSWQSDLPNKTNRGFIEDALENAAKAIRNDDSIQVEPVIDRDTSGVPGSPDIAKTNFAKIDQAHVFVCDISIINQESINQNGAVRPTPNPNVLLELGYALKTLGEDHVILVLNDVYGAPEWLPFDLRMRRVIRYHMPSETDDRATERRRLTGMLTDGLRTILNNMSAPLPGELIQPVSLSERAQSAVNDARPNRAALIRHYMDWLTKQIAELTPAFTPDQPDEQLIQAIHMSAGMILAYAQLTTTIAQMNDEEAARAMYKGFAGILDLYTFAPHPRALRYQLYEHDLAKFLGHELFVITFAALLREERWELIGVLLDEDLFARTDNFESPQLVPYYHLSESVISLDELRRQRLQSNRISHRADLLVQRHEEGAEESLSEFAPLTLFADTDCLLFLRAQVQTDPVPEWPRWMPWSSLYLRQPPRYLHEARQTRYAQHLLRVFNISDIVTLRERLAACPAVLSRGWGAGPFRVWHNPLAGFDFNTIGSR